MQDTNIKGPKKSLKQYWNISNFAATSAPHVFDDVVYISADESFYALDANTGNTIWVYKIPGQATTPVFYKNMLIFGGNYLDSHVYAVDKNSGEHIWKYRAGPLAASVKRTPVIYNDSLYLLAGKTIHCLSLLTGKKEWTFDLKKKAGLTNLVIASGQLYAATQAAIGKEELNCVDISLKESQWKIKSPNLKSELVCTDTALFYLNTDAELCEVNLLNGELQKAKILELTSRETNFYLAHIEGLLVIVIGHHMLALNLSATPRIWQWTFRSRAVVGKPVITNEAVYFATKGDGIYALDLQSGKQLFHTASEVRSGLACGIGEDKIFVAGSMSEKELTAYREA